jgi:hypothetical protein
MPAAMLPHQFVNAASSAFHAGWSAEWLRREHRWMKVLERLAALDRSTRKIQTLKVTSMETFPPAATITARSGRCRSPGHRPSCPFPAACRLQVALRAGAWWANGHCNALQSARFVLVMASPRILQSSTSVDDETRGSGANGDEGRRFYEALALKRPAPHSRWQAGVGL